MGSLIQDLELMEDGDSELIGILKEQIWIFIFQTIILGRFYILYQFWTLAIYSIIVIIVFNRYSFK